MVWNVSHLLLSVFRKKKRKLTLSSLFHKKCRCSKHTWIWFMLVYDSEEYRYNTHIKKNAAHCIFIPKSTSSYRWLSASIDLSAQIVKHQAWKIEQEPLHICTKRQSFPAFWDICERRCGSLAGNTHTLVVPQTHHRRSTLWVIECTYIFDNKRSLIL